ncbi:MAG: putative negative regulator of RcsB-dependent stress response [Candidatus Endobugula sp.]
MADHLTEQEQLQQLKNWWKENGVSMAAAILVGLIAYFGFQWWQNNQQQQVVQASALYSDLLESIKADPVSGESVSEENKKTAYYIAEQLQTAYSDSLYAVNASLFAAKIAVEDGDIVSAEKALRWATDNSDGAIKGIAALRLARIYVAQEKFDDALILVGNSSAALQSLNAELRGDILLAKNDISGAQAAYQEALDTVGETASFRRQLLPIKLANINGSGAS